MQLPHAFRSTLLLTGSVDRKARICNSDTLLLLTFPSHAGDGGVETLSVLGGDVVILGGRLPRGGRDNIRLEV